MAPEDKILLKALRSKDQGEINNAFEKIYFAYVKLIAFVVGKYVGDEEIIKEIVNETFFLLFSHAENVAGGIKYYLTTTAKNLSLDYLKKNKGENIEFDESYALKEDEYSLDYEDTVKELKKHLSDEEIDIILLHVINGYTFKEIAAKIGKKQNTVITAYNRAIRRYKKEVK